jgi:acetyltransferase-like isoleucine patch superfamily enzyme
MFGPNVQIYAVTHPIEISPRRAGSETAYPITVVEFSIALTVDW